MAFVRTMQIAAVLLLAGSGGQLAAQVDTRLRVGPFGAVSDPLPPIPVPSELKQFVPEGFVLRAMLRTKMSPEGETLLLYDNGDEIFPNVRLSAIRRGKREVKLFDKTVARFAGVVPSSLQKNRQAVSLAYHFGFDESDTAFIILAAEKGTYVRVFERQTTEGRIRILGEAPLKIEVWSADLTLDPSKSCVWCPHRYSVETYVWRRSALKLIGRRTTAKPLIPGDIAMLPFQVGSGPE